MCGLLGPVACMMGDAELARLGPLARERALVGLGIALGILGTCELVFSTCVFLHLASGA